jgi:hypothetical protein
MSNSFAEKIANDVLDNTHLNSLQEIPRQFILQEEYKRLKNLLGNYDFIRLKLKYLGIQELLGDYERARPFITSFYFSPLESALRQAQNILSTEPEQLPSQLWIQLSQYKEQDERLRRLLAQIEKSPNPWLKPSSQSSETGINQSSMSIDTQYERPLGAISISGDGEWAATTDGVCEFKVWDLSTATLKTTCKVQGFGQYPETQEISTRVTDIALNQDGSWALAVTKPTGADRIKIEAWNLRDESNNAFDQFEYNDAFVEVLAINKNGKIALIYFSKSAFIWLPGERNRENSISFPVCANLTQINSLLLNAYTSAVALSPNGRWSVTRSGDCFLYWNVLKASLIRQVFLPNKIGHQQISLTNSGELTLISGNKVLKVDLDNKNEDSPKDIRQSVIRLREREWDSDLDKSSFTYFFFSQVLSFCNSRIWARRILGSKWIRPFVEKLLILMGQTFALFYEEQDSIDAEQFYYLWNRVERMHEFRAAETILLGGKSLAEFSAIDSNARIGLFYKKNSRILQVVDLQKYGSLVDFDRDKDISGVYALTKTGNYIQRSSKDNLFVFDPLEPQNSRQFNREIGTSILDAEVIDVAESINLRHIFLITKNKGFIEQDRNNWLHYQTDVSLRFISHDGNSGALQDKSGTLFSLALNRPKDSKISTIFEGFDGYIGYGRLYPATPQSGAVFEDPFRTKVHKHLVFGRQYDDESEENIQLIRAIACISNSTSFAVFYSLDAGIDYFWNNFEISKFKDLINGQYTTWAAGNPQNKILIARRVEKQSEFKIYFLPDPKKLVRCALALSCSDNILLCCDFGTVYCINPAQRSIRAIISDYNEIINLAISPDDLWLAVMTYDAKLTIFHQPTGRRVAGLNLSRWLYTACFVKRNMNEYDLIAVDSELKS